MPFHDTVQIPPKVWTEITISDATVITAQAQSPGVTFMTPTVGATPPTSKQGSTKVNYDVALSGTFAELWPGLPGANRVYVWREMTGEVLVSHD